MDASLGGGPEPKTRGGPGSPGPTALRRVVRAAGVVGCLAMSVTGALVSLTVPADAAPPVAPAGSVTVVGSGFGHGVGLSQYGAYGMALGGASAQTILTHYYTGTTVQAYRDDLDLRVNVVDRGTQVTLHTESLASGGGRFELLPDAGPAISLGTGDTAVVAPSAGGVTVLVTHADGTTSALTSTGLGVRWSGARGVPGPATVLQVDSRSAGATATKTRRYRWGALALATVPRTDPDGVVRPRLEATALLDLHGEYLRGLDEVPQSWPVAALQAQAVAARNYALAASGHVLPGCGGCMLWDDTRSQVYRGWDVESGYWGARWVQAVNATETSATDGEVVLYHGTPITAYYASSTGGRTRDAADVWGTAVPYLKSVDDRWSTDPAINPDYASWTRSVPLALAQAAFGLPAITSLVVTERDAGGAAMTVQATAADGTTRQLSGSAVASAFGLPAQWVTSFALPPKG